MIQMKKTVFITGATSGIGFAVARLLAAQGCRILLGGRTAANCDHARQVILADYPDADLTCFSGDLMLRLEVFRIADEVSAFLDQTCAGRLDVLINNAGGVRSQYATTPEGHEETFALNHLAGFLLTWRLMPYLQRASGRMIMTGSYSHRFTRIHWSDIMLSRHYNLLWAYKQSKLCNLLFAAEFNRRYGDSVRAYVVDPGLVKTDIGDKHTTGIARLIWLNRKKQGVPAIVPAQTYSFLCHENPKPMGLYYHLCQEQSFSREAGKPDVAARLFAVSEELCGIRFADAAKV